MCLSVLVFSKQLTIFLPVSFHDINPKTPKITKDREITYKNKLGYFLVLKKPQINPLHTQLSTLVYAIISFHINALMEK